MIINSEYEIMNINSILIGIYLNINIIIFLLQSNVEKLREPHFHKLLGQMKSLVDYKKTVDKLKKLGVEVDDYIALLIEYFELAP